MSKISKKSKNITSLCSELGYSKDTPGRDPSTLRSAITQFRKSFNKEGNHLPYGASVSPEAQQFALAFCQQSNRGAILWPSDPNKSWPCWPSDQSKILESLAHIFALQAQNFYKNNSKKDKNEEETPSTTPTLSVSPGKTRDQSASDKLRQLERDTRELSPDSEKIMNQTPIPPSGTRRRPAKNSEVVPPIYDLDDTIERNCNSEVLSLDPRKDDRPIREFDKEWISVSGARWPSAADIRIRSWMHEHNLYDPQATDIKIIPLIKSLRKGTQIEECSSHHAKDFMDRTKERIAELAEDMLKKGILRRENNTPKKSLLFKDAWMHRHSKYGPRTNAIKSAAAVQNRDVYSTDHLPPDPRPRAPVASMITKGAQPSSTALPTGTRRKLDASEGATTSEQQHKKRKTSITGPRPQTIVTPPLEQSETFPSTRPINDFAREDFSNIENLELARKSLSSTNEAEPKRPAQSLQRAESTSRGSRPMTPTSPIVSNVFNNTFPVAASRSASAPRGPVPNQEPDTSTTTSESPGQRTLQPSPMVSADRRQVTPMLQLPALILEKLDGSFDNENPLPSSYLCDLDVRGFFAWVSETTIKPRNSFDKLTFTFLFAEGADRLWLINEDDEAAWNKLQKKAIFLCKLYKKRKDESDLQLVVEFGDKTLGAIL